MRTRLFLLLCTAIFLPGNSAPGPVELQEIGMGKLLGAMRTLNTVEYSFKAEFGRFAAREEMLNYLAKADMAKLPFSLSDPTAIELRITTSADAEGEHYQIGLKQPTDSKDKNTWCRTSLFSDEAGVIYIGTALGCQEK